MADPRFIKGANDATVYDTAGGFLDPIGSPEEFAKRSGSTDIAGNTTTVDNPQSYLTGLFTKQATNRYQPQQDLSLQAIDQGNAQLDQNATDANRSYDTLTQSLEDAAKASTSTFEEQANNLGLLSSGLNAAGLGKISSDLFKNKGNAAADKASALAQIALQRAGLTTKAAGVKLDTQQSIQDMVNQLLSGSTAKQKEDFQQKLQLEQIAANVPVGKSISIQGQTIQGTMQPKLNYQDLGNKVVALDEKGNIIQTYAKGKTPGTGSGGFGTTGGSAADLSSDVRSAMGQVGAGKSFATREALITALVNKYASSKTIAPFDIATAVYSTLRGANEPAFKGLDQGTINWVNSLQGKAPTADQVKQTDAQAKTSANAQSGLEAIDKISSIIGGDKTALLKAAIPGSIGARTLTTAIGEAQDVITRLRTGAALNQEEEAFYRKQLPTVLDDPSTVQYKLNLFRTLFKKLSGGAAAGPSESNSTAAPAAGKLSTGNSFTVTKVP